MATTFRLTEHSTKKGIMIVEVLRDEKVIGAIYPTPDDQGIYVINAHIGGTKVENDFPGVAIYDDGVGKNPPIPAVTIKFDPRRYTIVDGKLVRAQPTEEKKLRPPCPVYGFNRVANMLMDQGDNQCGLCQKDGHRPCVMQADGQMPTWSLCPLVNAMPISDKHDMLDGVHVYPRELSSASSIREEGITLRAWLEVVTNPDFSS